MKKKLTPYERKVLAESLKGQNLNISKVQKSENKGFVGTPLFTPKQNDLFESSEKAVPLQTLVKSLPLDTIEDYAVVYLFGNGVQTASYEKFGDRNAITPGMRLNWLKKTGAPLDRYAQAVAENINQDEDTIIERTVEFIRRNPNPSDVRRYILSREAKPQKITVKNDVLSTNDVECLTDHAIKELGIKTVAEETKDFLKNPKGYFGALLDVPACSADLFPLNVADQIKVVTAMQKAVRKRADSAKYRKSTAKLTKARTRTVKQRLMMTTTKTQDTPMKKKSTAKPKTKKAPAKTGKAKTRKTNANAVKFGQKAKRMGDLMVLAIYQDGKNGRRIKGRPQYLKEAAAKVWK